MKVLKTIGRRGSSVASASVSRIGRTYISYVRWWLQLASVRVCGRVRRSEGCCGPLFIAGLPKSGTSWLEKMVADYAGYKPVMPASAIEYEIANKGSHTYNIQVENVKALMGTPSVLKLHAGPSSHNSDLLKELDINYIVQYRDLRDVAVSHYFYVKRTPWHPEYEVYASKDIKEGLRHFARTLLSQFADWISGWRQKSIVDRSLEIKYEELLDNSESVLAEVINHFDLPVDDERIRVTAKEHSFVRQSGGRSRGEEDRTSFRRKGVAGDWKNYFDDELENEYDRKVGDLLRSLGYE